MRRRVGVQRGQQGAGRGGLADAALQAAPREAHAARRVRRARRAQRGEGVAVRVVYLCSLKKVPS